jgi:CRISPR-associated protein Cmr1
MMEGTNDWPTVEPRAEQKGERLVTFSVAIKVVTPILGGSSRLREIDDIDVIRAPTVRGQLRFWWRALRGHDADPAALRDAERELWGGVGTTQVRSPVEVRIRVDKVGDRDDTDVRPSSPGAYALWPAREEPGRLAAPRRRPGTRFEVTVVVPATREPEVRDAMRAWLLFGGYGSRPRRGLGSLTVTHEANTWLPAAPTRREIAGLFDRDVLAAAPHAATETPRLAGASLLVGVATESAHDAWTAALGWLSEFRQAKTDSASSWPEADKVRHLTRRSGARVPRHNSIPAWPRASFGLPIVFRFKDPPKGREPEPGPHMLSWLPEEESKPADRLASPLVLKALPLANGRFVPCALWLHRTPPPGQVVLLGRTEGGSGWRRVPGSEAPYDRLVADGDSSLVPALRDAADMRSAFLGWLSRRPGISALAP